MEPHRPEIMLQFCKAMADESRLKIVGLLSAAEHSVQQLAAALDLKEPTVSHHLAVFEATRPGENARRRQLPLVSSG
jgi:DNA-binding transcriptional ArsR family regulator